METLVSAVTSRHVVAALRKAGYSAWKPGSPGFKVWSARGGDPHVCQYGFPKQAEREESLARYTDVLTAAGFVVSRCSHMLLVTGKTEGR